MSEAIKLHSLSGRHIPLLLKAKFAHNKFFPKLFPIFFKFLIILLDIVYILKSRFLTFVLLKHISLSFDSLAPEGFILSWAIPSV